jgi:hypothetical protein
MAGWIGGSTHALKSRAEAVRSFATKATSSILSPFSQADRLDPDKHLIGVAMLHE